jgi:molybdopterin-guanine dinucleotide biosynthesis protein A
MLVPVVLRESSWRGALNNPTMKKRCSGVILSEGLDSRFSDKDKALLTVGGSPVIDHLLAVFQPLFDDIVIVASDPTKYLSWDLHIVTDIFPFQSSLTGIHAGLFHAVHPHAFFAACNAPFLRVGVVHTLLDALKSSIDVVIPETSVGLKPLCAIYSTRCLAAIEKLLDRQIGNIPSFFPSVRVVKVQEKTLRLADPDLISFFHINTPQDLIRAERWLESGRKPAAAGQGDRDV